MGLIGADPHSDVGPAWGHKSMARQGRAAAQLLGVSGSGILIRGQDPGKELGQQAWGSRSHAGAQYSWSTAL